MVAVVEDDPSMRKAIYRIVRAMSLPVKAYESAEAFLQDQTPCSFDCLVLDIHLGGMSGLELMQDLRQKGLRLPVIFVTAMEGSAHQLQAEAMGCEAYLRKPFEADALIEAIDRVVRRGAARNGK
jgi:FixJ family two-component response regulator